MNLYDFYSIKRQSNPAYQEGVEWISIQQQRHADR